MNYCLNVDDARIATIFNRISFVRWDRYVETPMGLMFYGWIDREKDQKKDFILMCFEKDRYWFVTSSADRSEKISDLLGFKKGSHDDCKRVESLEWAKLVNCIHLKK